MARAITTTTCCADRSVRIKNGSIPARFETRVVEITPTTVVVENKDGARDALPAEAVFLLTVITPMPI